MLASEDVRGIVLGALIGLAFAILSYGGLRDYLGWPLLFGCFGYGITQIRHVK